jgi:hypothetical protein
MKVMGMLRNNTSQNIVTAERGLLETKVGLTDGIKKETERKKERSLTGETGISKNRLLREEFSVKKKKIGNNSGIKKL